MTMTVVARKTPCHTLSGWLGAHSFNVTRLVANECVQILNLIWMSRTMTCATLQVSFQVDDCLERNVAWPTVKE